MWIDFIILKNPDPEKALKKSEPCSVGFFRFWAPNSERFFGLTQANFEANSADFHHLTQNFGNFKQKLEKNKLTEPKSSKNLATGPKYLPNSLIFLSNSAKIFL